MGSKPRFRNNGVLTTLFDKEVVHSHVPWASDDGNARQKHKKWWKWRFEHVPVEVLASMFGIYRIIMPVELCTNLYNLYSFILRFALFSRSQSMLITSCFPDPSWLMQVTLLNDSRLDQSQPGGPGSNHSMERVHTWRNHKKVRVHF